MAVFVLDKRGTPLMPCSEKRARLLLARGRARVHRLVPFTIRIVDRLLADSALQPFRVKIDPGSTTTGMALVSETAHTTTVLGLFELMHRGRQISAALRQRAHFRRRRRSTHLRYRAPRFSNRTKPAGWLPPSLQHRVETTVTWVNRLQRLAPMAALSVELVRFDTQLLEHPGIAGVAYQHGTLAGYELREYLLAKWERQCAYCDKQDVPLQIEHIMPTSHGGSHRVANLTLACGPCNQHKGSRDIRDFVTDDTRLQRILAHAKAPLRDAAAVNTTRWALYHGLQATGRMASCKASATSTVGCSSATTATGMPNVPRSRLLRSRLAFLPGLHAVVARKGFDDHTTHTRSLRRSFNIPLPSLRTHVRDCTAR